MDLESVIGWLEHGPGRGWTPSRSELWTWPRPTAASTVPCCHKHCWWSTRSAWSNRPACAWTGSAAR
jgi:hypothetical protein